MKKIVLDLEKEGKSYTFFGDPDPNSPSLEFENVIAPGDLGPEPHVHMIQKETFHVISGKMIARVGGEERILNAGETIEVPAGVVHSFSNGSSTEPLVNRIVVEPALNFQWFMTEAAKSAIRNGGSMKKIPLLEGGHLMFLARKENRDGTMPYFLQYILFGVLSLFAILTGKSKNISPMNK
jgi:mannose-6-phosphate isomerase-like protein (cupin superfamily)